MISLSRRWLRRLTAPLGRRGLLALALAAAWAWWAWAPLAPVRSWSVTPDIGVLVAFSRDGTTVVTVAAFPWGRAGPVRLWDLATGRERFRVLDANAPTPRAYLAPDNSWLLTVDAKNGLIL